MSETLPLSVQLRLEEVCAPFEEAWQAAGPDGAPPRVEDDLGTTAGPERAALLRELILIDLHYRRARGEEPSAAEYEARCRGDESAVRALFAAMPPATETAGSDTPPADGAAGDPPDGEFLRPPEAPDEVGRLGGFRVLRRLGAGGMGIVFEAEDPALGRRVALKVMQPARAASAEHRQRFLREARAAAALQHDHVVPIHLVGEDNGVAYIVMPLLRGETLEDRLLREGALPTAEVLRIGREAAEGLAAAHSAGQVHRDVKPANIWLEEGAGRVKLLDFGLARTAEGEPLVTRAGALLGTPAYMSPEQADGLPVTERSDLFSLGCVLYRAATAGPPFAGATLTAVLRAVADHQPAPPHEVNADVPRPLSHLIMRLLAKSPEDRPAGAVAVAHALRDLTNRADQPSSTVAFPPPRAGRRWRRKVVAVAGVLLGLSGLLLAVLHPWVWWAGWVTGRDTPTAPAVTYQGSVNVVVWKKVGGDGRRMWLGQRGTLPLVNGDQYRVEAKVSPSAYLYVLLIDSDGDINPVYPWEPGKWGTRPAVEEKLSELELPRSSVTKRYSVNGKGSGMWTLLLLARDEPWGLSDEEIRGLFAGLAPQRPVRYEDRAEWFVNGRWEMVEVLDDGRRAVEVSLSFDETDVDDPVLRARALLREKLQPHARFTTAVSFAKRDK
jgi:serine/threonine protein kinase